MYKYFIKPIFFLFQPETIHHFSSRLLKFFLKPGFMLRWVRNSYCLHHPSLKRHVFGLDFTNPIGLAAGFDKDAILFDEYGAFGFGFIEIGTVTPLPQSGNDKPRLFRLTKDKAIINRMGFNNKGASSAAVRLKKRRTKNLIIGGNIGKNKVTENNKAIDDYLACFHSLYPVVDYFVVNVSSPNTPNLRALQEKEPLTALLKAIMEASRKKPEPKPVLLKIAPDLTVGQLDDIIEIVQESGISGIIATNTTISREGLESNQEQIQAIGSGGLSGKPLTKKSTEIIRYLHTKSGGNIPIIGVGGINSPEDAIEKLEAGASLVQVYTGFIYEGPGLIKKINKALIKHYHDKTN